MTTIGIDPQHDDTSDDRFYCQHGTYTGTPGGPDHMCGWCEMGEDPPTHTDEELYEIARKRSHKILAPIERMVAGLVRDHVMGTGRYAACWDILDDLQFQSAFIGPVAWCAQHDDWPEAPA